jgi:hypothetical protein
MEQGAWSRADCIMSRQPKVERTPSRTVTIRWPALPLCGKESSHLGLVSLFSEPTGALVDYFGSNARAFEILSRSVEAGGKCLHSLACRCLAPYRAVSKVVDGTIGKMKTRDQIVFAYRIVLAGGQ